MLPYLLKFEKAMAYYGLLTTGVCFDGLQGWFQNDLSLMMMHLYLIEGKHISMPTANLFVNVNRGSSGFEYDHAILPWKCAF